MVSEWTRVLQDVVPEYRLAEVFVRVRQTRTTVFAMDVSEICRTWDEMKSAERSLRPATRPIYSKDVCKQCNGTDTRLFKRFDPVLGREYEYAEVCDHQ